MKRLWTSPLAAVLMMTCALAFSGCVTGSGPGPDEPSSDAWPDVVQCVKDKIPSAIDQITEALLAGDDPTEALVDIAELHGFDVVACGVSQVIDDWTSPGATLSPERLEAVDRGRAFLKTEGIEVKTVGEPSSYLRDLNHIRLAYPDQRTPRYGFIPLERDPLADPPWHVELSAARGVRS